MKRQLTTVLAIAALSVGVGFCTPAQANTRDRTFVVTVIEKTFDGMSMKSVELYCTVWRGAPATVYETIGANFKGRGISAKDIRAGIHKASDTQCDLYDF